VSSRALVLAHIVVNAFANESYKTKSCDDINQDKMVVLEARTYHPTPPNNFSKVCKSD
jgi:hypothetical protein